MSADLEVAIAAANRATLQFHGLMAIHGIDFKKLGDLVVWPAGLHEAHEAWTAGMVGVVKALAREKGIPDASRLSEYDRVALTVLAYDLVMS